jgi:NADH dehydrogenase
MENTQHRPATPHRVVIIGGGFGGLNAAKALNHTPVQVTLIDRRNFHLFQPLLYQVATGALSPANIAAPLRAILKAQTNTQVLLGDVSAIDVAARTVQLRDDGLVPYDSLIVAAGVSHAYFGHDDWEPFASGLKTIEDATAIRAQVLSAFEQAERETDPARIHAWLTFVIVGGGPTGVELAGAIGEIAHYTLRQNFRRINPADATILLVEGLDRVLPTYPNDLSDEAVRELTRMGVTVKTGTLVTDVRADQVTFKHGDSTEVVGTHTILWAAGVQASHLGKLLADSTGAPIDRAGRLTVNPDLTLPNHPEIFVIGDMATFTHQTGKPLPGVAQVAIQMGRYAADTIGERVRGEVPGTPFTYHNLGNMATIGRASAVADLPWAKLRGFIGWSAWLFIHLISLIAFENRVLVVFQWAWSYFSRNRAARLITNPKQI